MEYLKSLVRVYCTREEPGLQESRKHLTTQNASPAALDNIHSNLAQNGLKWSPLSGIKGNGERCKKTGPSA